MIRIAAKQSGTSLVMVPLGGAKVRAQNSWMTIKPTDKIYLNGQWHEVGGASAPPSDSLLMTDTSNLSLSIITGDGTQQKTVTLSNISAGVWDTGDTGVCYCGAGCCGRVLLSCSADGWGTICFSGSDGGCWYGSSSENPLPLNTNLIEDPAWTWQDGQGVSMIPKSVIITKQ